jgi:cation transport protein ChaC
MATDDKRAAPTPLPASTPEVRALSRHDLEMGRMRDIYLRSALPNRALSDAQLSKSLNATLARKPKGAGWWVFAYGSLLWNPIFPIAEAKPALVRGLHRRFCLWSMAARGTAVQPGLVLALVPGGSCRGIAFRLPSVAAIDELHLLWRREMVVGSYAPKWVKFECDGRAQVGLAFTVRRDHPQYAGKLTLEQQVSVIGSACGHLGTSQDYLERTRVALVAHGIVDPYLEQLAAGVAKVCSAGAR